MGLDPEWCPFTHRQKYLNDHHFFHQLLRATLCGDSTWTLDQWWCSILRAPPLAKWEVEAEFVADPWAKGKTFVTETRKAAESLQMMIPRDSFLCCWKALLLRRCPGRWTTLLCCGQDLSPFSCILRYSWCESDLTTSGMTTWPTLSNRSWIITSITSMSKISFRRRIFQCANRTRLGPSSSLVRL